MFIHKHICFFIPLVCCLPAFSQGPTHVDMVKVESRSSARTVPLTAELAPFLQTDVEARSPGYVEKVLVDRGSLVHKGQLLVQLSAPEIGSQRAASEANLHQAEAEVAQAEAQAAAASSTSARLEEAAKTPGAVAGNEAIAGPKAMGRSAGVSRYGRKAAVRTAKERLQASQEVESYLRVTAPVRWNDYRPIWLIRECSSMAAIPRCFSKPSNRLISSAFDSARSRGDLHRFGRQGNVGSLPCSGTSGKKLHSEGGTHS